MDYYNLLNLPFDATTDELRAAYFAAARMYHPDAANGLNSEKLFINIQQAYDTLSNPARRKAYDHAIPPAAKEKSSLVIDAVYSSQAMQKIDDPQLVYVLLTFGTNLASIPQNRPPIHLAIIIDRSTSMRGERMEMVQKNLLQLFRWLKPDDVVSIVAFSDRAELIVEPTALKDVNQIESRLLALSVYGATEIYQGLELGFEVFKRTAGRSDLAKHLLLITDGHTYGDEEKCFQLAETANQEGVIFNTLGIGEDWNDKFIDRLSALSGGNAVYISSDRDLLRFIEQKIQSISQKYVRKTELHFELPENVTLRYAFRNQPDISPLETTSPIQIGTVDYGRKTSVILQFVVNGLTIHEKAKIGSGKVIFDIPSRPIPIDRHFIEFSLPIRENWSLERAPASVVNAMARISLYRLQEKAKEEVNAGNIDLATHHLQLLASRLLARGETELAGAALSEAESLQENRKFSIDGEKYIKYGTRSLNMPLESEMNDHD